MPNMDALILVMQERLRQVVEEGYTPAHDDEHTEGQLALLAAAYALSSRGQESGRAAGIELTNILAALDCWKWHFKPKDPIRDLVRAGALILAEIERRLRIREEKPCLG